MVILMEGSIMKNILKILQIKYRINFSKFIKIKMYYLNLRFFYTANLVPKLTHTIKII